MKKIGVIFKAIFVFILPLALALNFLFMFVQYNATYYYKGIKYLTNNLSGFPIPDNGIFYDINGMVTSGNSTTNGSLYILNKIIILSICIFIYYKLLRKLSLVGKTKIITITLAVIIYLFIGYISFIFTSMQVKYEYGIWPDKIEIENIRWQIP